MTAAVAALLAVAACGDGGRSDREATEEVFLETCAPGGTAMEVDVCRCAFDLITSDMSDDQLARLDRNLRDEPETVPEAITAAALDCAAEPLTPPTFPQPTQPTTTSTTSKP